MKLESVVKGGFVVVLVTVALVVQSIAFDRRLEQNRAELVKEVQQGWDAKLQRIETRMSDLEAKLSQRSGDTLPLSAGNNDAMSQSVRKLEQRLEKVEKTAAPVQASDASSAILTSDMKPTPQFKETLRGTVQEIMKEQQEKDWQARRDGMRVNYETALRKEMTNVAIAPQVQDQLVKIYQEESGQWANVWWGEYQSKLRDGSFKDLTPEELQKKRTEIDEKLKQLEAGFDQKKNGLLTPDQFQKMKEFEKKYWNRN